MVLAFPDGHEEVRLTDRPLQLGQVLTIGSRRWTAVRERRLPGPKDARRVRCEPFEEQRTTIANAQVLAAALRGRLEQLLREPLPR
ncbi:MAG TPA: hypothetical protein VFL60_08390 [Gaiellaceae bacterium]|nr:hypothetical protein [Gaiellaceae bacterium]